MNEPTIRIMKSAHNTTDVIVYNTPLAITNWFALVDIWGSRGYDRFGDGGLYFEVPIEMYDIVPCLPFVNRFGIKIKKECSVENMDNLGQE